jgi:hypothetical protein
MVDAKEMAAVSRFTSRFHSLEATFPFGCEIPVALLAVGKIPPDWIITVIPLLTLLLLPVPFFLSLLAVEAAAGAPPAVSLMLEDPDGITVVAPEAVLVDPPS